MAYKKDPLNGLNPDQSGPKEKIQNGDPHSSPNRDQRSGAAEAGGPNPSLDHEAMGGKHGEVPPHSNLVIVPGDTRGETPLPATEADSGIETGDGETHVQANPQD